MSLPYKAPFPWFGGKRRVAAAVWERFGDTRNYIEPFAGSLAVLLARPFPVRTETVNDIDGYLCNVWRALQADPVGVAEHADYPVNELDLHARHRWLATRKVEFTEQLRADPDFYDAKFAGWWLWGIGCWIGDNWCRANTPAAPPDMYPAHGKGVHGDVESKRPSLGHGGRSVVAPVNSKMPGMARPGSGVHAKRDSHANSDWSNWRSRPHLKDAASGVHTKRDALCQWFGELQVRLRHVRVCCGDWTRIMGDTPILGPGTPTGIFLDPPYKLSGRDRVYGENETDVAEAVWRWCLEHGDDSRLRIALCGYEGEHEMPGGWECLAWKASGGYGNQRKSSINNNAGRERVWFSPHCLKPASAPAISMFGEEWQ